MDANGLPSRTSILTAAGRALGSRELDPSVRNPDWMAERLIGPSELTLIADHPISRAFDEEIQVAMNDPDVFGFAWLMLVRTRHIDARLTRALADGATQVVLLGSGFDTRAHRFADLLQQAAVFEVDHAATQAYKRRRVEETLGGAPPNLEYVSIDFTRESLRDVLAAAGFDQRRKAFFICEGVSMYVPEAGMKETLGAVAASSAPGSTLVLEYINRAGLEVLVNHPAGMIKNAFEWGEPFVFGVPDGRDQEFFLDCGLQLGERLKIGSPESVQRYAMCGNGTYYGSHLAMVFEQRREASMKAMDAASRAQAEKAAATSGYWLAELTVP